MTSHGFPKSVEEVTTAWLTAALHEGGVLDGGSVAGFEAELIGQGVGIISGDLDV